jgi:hypothetical protein
MFCILVTNIGTEGRVTAIAQRTLAVNKVEDLFSDKLRTEERQSTNRYKSYRSLLLGENYI